MKSYEIVQQKYNLGNKPRYEARCTDNLGDFVLCLFITEAVQTA